jgi:putative hydrolase of the HAD superfamily
VGPGRAPRGLLFDLGNTLLAEGGVDSRAGNARMLALASSNPRGASVDDLCAYAARLDADLQPRRQASLIELPWASFTRLLYARFEIRFEATLAELEIEFWRAAMQMRPEPNVAAALDQVAARGLPMGVVSNSSFSGRALQDELERHGLAGHLAFVIASADYGVRKPHPRLFEAAAGRLGLEPRDVWFIGDSLANDMVGAAAPGMGRIWYNPDGQAGDGTAIEAEIRDWLELTGLLPD